MNRKILVTGSGGFIGSHLAELLVESGYEVKCLVRYNSKNSYGWLEQSKYLSEIEIVTGDIRDYDSVYKASQNCFAIFHLAALIGIPYSYISPLAYIKTNIEGTYNIVETAKVKDIDQVIITSTSETYGSAQYVPINENHPLVGQSPYSASKIAADQLALSYFKSFETPIKIVRPFNTYGPRQSARAIIPSIISQILSGVKAIKVGNTSPTRDLTYVQDTCNGFLEIFKSDSFLGEVTNIGMSIEISVQELIELIISIMEVEIEVITESERIRPMNSEVNRLLCDNSKLLKNSKWCPLYSINSGLHETISWIKRHIEKYKSDIYNV